MSSARASVRACPAPCWTRCSRSAARDAAPVRGRSARRAGPTSSPCRGRGANGAALPRRATSPDAATARPQSIARARAAFLFDGPARAAVHRLKFAGWRPVAEALGAAMAGSWDLEAGGIAWVPLSRRRRAARGFDQAQALARVVGRRLDLPRPRAARADGRRRSAGTAHRRGAATRDAGPLRGAGATSRARAARRRRAHDGGDGGGVRGDAARGGGPGGVRAHGRPGRVRGDRGPILGIGHASGSVVARGTAPR